jgi:hypothetical protein
MDKERDSAAAVTMAKITSHDDNAAMPAQRLSAGARLKRHLRKWWWLYLLVLVCLVLVIILPL